MAPINRSNAPRFAAPGSCAAFLTLITVALLGGCTGGSTSGRSDPGASTTFSKSYGGPLQDDAQVVLNTDDGGFLLLGSADGEDFVDSAFLQGGTKGSPYGGDFWLQKLDADGNLEYGRTIGLRGASLPQTDWKRARPTADGGAVLVGTHAVTAYLPHGGGSANVTIERDIAVIKLDANGNPQWNVTYDSGGWLNYGYFELNGFAAAAEDWGQDIWPMPDGGFLVAGMSVGNLEDRHGIGFPCDDEELNAVAHHEGTSNCDPGQGGSRFIRAFSTVVMRLNADGTLRWTQRLIDNPYDTDVNEHALFGNLDVLIRGTADGGAILAHGTGEATLLLYRLDAIGATRWRRLFQDVLPTNGWTLFGAGPVDVIQTNDPVDGPGGGQFDREPDDGFALALDQRVIKLDADGAREWDSEIRLATEDTGFGHPLDILGLAQYCYYGRPPSCDLVIVGRMWRLGKSSHSGFAAFLDEGGDVIDEAYPADAGGGSFMDRVLRIAAAPDGSMRLLGADQDRLRLAEIPPPPFGAAFTNERSADAHVEVDHPSEAQLRADGGVLVFQAEKRPFGSLDIGQSLQFLDPQGQLQRELPLERGVHYNDRLRAAAKIGPNQYVLAGLRSAPNGESGIVALRYDLDAEGGRVIWQRRLADGASGKLNVLTALPSGDGGVMLGLAVPSTSEFGDDPDAEASLLLKLDADGHEVWQVGLPAHIEDLTAMPDGRFAVLSSSQSDALIHVTRVVPPGSGDIWQRRVALLDAARIQRVEQGVITTLTATADGGLLLAGSFGSRITLLRLLPDGSRLSSSTLRLPSRPDQQISFENLRIRRAFDGGYVLAMTEHGLLTGSDTDGAPLPLGQSNVLVLKIDDNGAPLWAHVYGALLDEGVRDVAPRADGIIAVAGYSDSLGERREAWLLKLSPLGQISSSGCQAHLASFRPEELLGDGAQIGVVESEPNFLRVTSSLEILPFQPFIDTHAGTYTPSDFVTARQCFGNTESGTSIAPPAATRHLTILQVGTQRGVVISDPSGISCNAGVNICAADFPVGTRVTLRADRDGFVAWRGDCDEGTGGTRLDCVILLNGDRTMQVDFGRPPDERSYQLSVNLQGNGRVSGGGIDCRANSPSTDCAGQFIFGTAVALVAQPDAGTRFTGWSDDCATFGAQTNITVTVDRTLSCGAQFSPGGTETPLIAITVTGDGVVRDVNGPGIDCRAGGTTDACQENYADGTVVTLTAVADPGRRFLLWRGDCASFAGTTRINLLAATSFVCTAEFTSASVPNGGPSTPGGT